MENFLKSVPKREHLGMHHANKVKYNYTKKKSLSGYYFLQIISCLNYLKTTLCRLTLRFGIPIPVIKIT